MVDVVIVGETGFYGGFASGAVFSVGGIVALILQTKWGI